MVIMEEQENSYFLNNVTEDSPQKHHREGDLMIDSDEVRTKERTFGKDLENLLSPFGGGLSTIGHANESLQDKPSKKTAGVSKCISSKYL